MAKLVLEELGLVWKRTGLSWYNLLCVSWVTFCVACAWRQLRWNCSLPLPGYWSLPLLGHDPPEQEEAVVSCFPRFP